MTTSLATLIVSLLTWIGAHSNHDISKIEFGKDFKIKIVSQEHLSQLYFIDGTPAGDVGAIFEPFSNTIYLSEKFKVDDEYEVSLLVHELVHVLQDQEAPLKNRELYKTADSEAYRLQARYLKEKGLKMEALLTELMGQYQTVDMTE